MEVCSLEGSDGFPGYTYLKLVKLCALIVYMSFIPQWTGFKNFGKKEKKKKDQVFISKSWKKLVWLIA